MEHSGTPYFCCKDIDENKPSGSIKIRVETIGYFLKRYREDMVKNKQKQLSIEEQLAEFEARLRAEFAAAERHKLAEASGFVPLDSLQPQQNEMAEMTGD